MRTSRLVPLALAAAVAPACAIDAGDPDDPDTTAAEFCLAPPTPPAADAIWLLGPGDVRSQVIDDYGTSACSAYVLGARSAEKFTVRAVGITDEDDCVETTFTVLRYRKQAGTWHYDSYETEIGDWTASGTCDLLISYSPHTTEEGRIHVSGKRTSCAGMWCGTTYGLPFRVAASAFVPGGGGTN
jgi:hypothetical protein